MQFQDIVSQQQIETIKWRITIIVMLLLCCSFPMPAEPRKSSIISCQVEYPTRAGRRMTDRQTGKQEELGTGALEPGTDRQAITAQYALFMTPSLHPLTENNQLVKVCLLVDYWNFWRVSPRSQEWRNGILYYLENTVQVRAKYL